MSVLQITARNKEQPACQTAIIQALRFHFHLRVMQISQMLDIPPQSVSSLTVGVNHVVLQWWEREYKADAIDAAQELLTKCTSHPLRKSCNNDN